MQTDRTQGMYTKQKQDNAQLQEKNYQLQQDLKLMTEMKTQYAETIRKLRN
jgi:hypothetical protein